ncbi:MAG: GNAT family N-acetyltransferase [Euryarchaeota archaeon]|nr:GNAT family N-acetyltransferase [Euryarchaeota archaeon]MDE2046716.1 GNAT family N-acetyltransferase [Thermoplasmata archaeon]
MKGTTTVGGAGRFPTNRIRLKTGTTATIRLAVPDDAQAITDLVNVVGAERRFVLRERATWTIGDERKTLEAADGRESAFFVVEVDGKIRGLLNVGRGRWSKDAHVATLGMSCHPDFRGIGLGTALLSQALDWARSVGVKKVSLEVFSTNAAAISLYRKMGFQEEGRLKGHFLIDDAPVEAVFMALWF